MPKSTEKSTRTAWRKKSRTAVASRVRRTLSTLTSIGLVGSISQYVSFNLLYQGGEIGTTEAQPGSRNAVVFDVRWNVFVVRETAGQARIVGVFPGIVPIELLLPLPNLV